MAAPLRALLRRLAARTHRHVWLIDWIDPTHVRCWCGAHPTNGDPS